MFTQILVWQPGEIAGMFVFQPGKVVYVHVDTRVAAWRKNGEICVRAWKFR